MPMREKSSAWSELNMTIVAQEHGTEAAIKLAQAPSEKDERTHVDVSTTGDRIDVTVHGATGFDTRHLDTPESERAFQSDLQSPKTPSAVVLEPSKSTTPATVARIITLVKAAGVTTVDTEEPCPEEASPP